METNMTMYSTESCISPRDLAIELPPDRSTLQTVSVSRSVLQNIIAHKDQRLMVICGPCSIHSVNEAEVYAQKLARLRYKYHDRLEIIMRVYLEKPRTSTGWKGLIYDPNLDGSCDMESGLKIARGLLLSITSMGLPVATELLDPLVSLYISDLISWASIGARTAESQIHRQMASGLSMPVGFKNGTDGSVDTAINAIASSRSSHRFLSVNRNGKVCVLKTAGNQWGHVVLRGGSDGPNYDAQSILNTSVLLKTTGFQESIIVDCSHRNSGKDYRNQISVCETVAGSRTKGLSQIVGVMLESNLCSGKQSFSSDMLHQLEYGLSITDPCIGWEETETLLERIYNM
jgi:3-deoxy-7-phosphoheptulonate synthase